MTFLTVSGGNFYLSQPANQPVQRLVIININVYNRRGFLRLSRQTECTLMPNDVLITTAQLLFCHLCSFCIVGLV